MITKGAKVLVIAAIDGTTLSDALQKAADERHQGHRLRPPDPRLAERRLLRHLRQLPGRRAAGAVDRRQALGLKEGKGPFNIELFGGSPDDNNAFFFYNGAMSVLQPYIDSGKLVVQSKQMGMDKVGTLRWDGAVARPAWTTCCQRVLHQRAASTPCCRPMTACRIGIIVVAQGRRLRHRATSRCRSSPARTPRCRRSSRSSRGEQYSTIFKDTRELAKVTVDMVDAVLAGGKPEVNDTKTYNNGVKVVPSYLLKPVAVDKSNWKKVADRQRLLQGRDS